MSEGITCYHQDEMLCSDPLCASGGCVMASGGHMTDAVSHIASDRKAMAQMMAEFGFRCAERGMNLQGMLAHFNATWDGQPEDKESEREKAK